MRGIVEAIEGARARDHAAACPASAQALIGRFDAARATAGLIEGTWRAWTYQRLDRMQVEAGDEAGARRWVLALEPGLDSSHALLGLAQGIAKRPGKAR